MIIEKCWQLTDAYQEIWFLFSQQEVEESWILSRCRQRPIRDKPFELLVSSKWILDEFSLDSFVIWKYSAGERAYLHSITTERLKTGSQVLEPSGYQLSWLFDCEDGFLSISCICKFRDHCMKVSIQFPFETNIIICFEREMFEKMKFC